MMTLTMMMTLHDILDVIDGEYADDTKLYQKYSILCDDNHDNIWSNNHWWTWVIALCGDDADDTDDDINDEHVIDFDNTKEY